jgi:hypothetical protein
MDKKKKNESFKLRSFTSFSLVFSTIIMSWSGFILYVAPPGRIANWSDWKLMLFTKAEWQALHTIFSYMFFILFVIHLFFVNWKAFLTYFRSKVKAGLNRKWELLAATVVSAVFFIGTLESWTPFGPVMTFGEKVKESWERNYASPPVAHMEEFTLGRLMHGFPAVTPDEIVATLRDSGITVTDTSLTIIRIANDNDITPERLYEIISKKYSGNKGIETSLAPSGVGKMTLESVAGRLDMDIAELLSIAAENGVTASGSSTMKSVADQLGISPHELYALFADTIE